MAVRLNVKSTQMVIKADTYYPVKAGEPAVVKQRVSPALNKTDITEFVLDYATQVYQTEDGKLKVWMSKDLPSYVNGGLPLQIPGGAVLKYELTNNGQKVVATLVKLEQITK